MIFVLVALLIVFAAATAIALADSGLRLWSAFGGLQAQQAMLRNGNSVRPARRCGHSARVPMPVTMPASTRVSYARSAAIPLHAAA